MVKESGFRGEGSGVGGTDFAHSLKQFWEAFSPGGTSIEEAPVVGSRG